MSTSSSTVDKSATLTLEVSGMSGVEAGRVLSRLHHMRKIGLLSKEVKIEESDTNATGESLRIHTYGGL